MFPYRALFGRRLEEEEQPNACDSQQYIEILNDVEVFVLYRIRELTLIRVGQSPFRLVQARAAGKPGALRRAETRHHGSSSSPSKKNASGAHVRGQAAG